MGLIITICRILTLIEYFNHLTHYQCLTHPPTRLNRPLHNSVTLLKILHLYYFEIFSKIIPPFQKIVTYTSPNPQKRIPGSSSHRNFLGTLIETNNINFFKFIIILSYFVFVELKLKNLACHKGNDKSYYFIIYYFIIFC